MTIEAHPSFVKLLLLYNREPVSSESLARLSSLAEPVRWTLYRLVASESGGVGRDRAAAATGLSRSTASYHLDRLVADGLLKVRYERLTGRTGPGSGRPAKIYERASEALEVSLPPRDYQTVAALLATAMERESGSSGGLVEVAREFGRDLWRHRDDEAHDEPTCPVLVSLLARRGYEPYTQVGDVKLRNCPFDALAQTHRKLICAMNLAIIQGLIEEAGEPGVTALLAPEDGHCCVLVVATPDGHNG